MKLLLADENFPFPSVEALRSYGHNVRTMLDLGVAEKELSDEEVLRLAISENRAVVTLNRRHFIQLHRRVTSHRGIVVCTFDPGFQALAKRIHDQIESFSSLDNQLIRITRQG